MDQPVLAGQNALVTGASRGLGLATALQLAKTGAHLALLARDPVALEAAASRVCMARVSDDQQVRCYSADLADERRIDAAIAACLSDFGGVEVLVNNAAIQGPIGSFDEVERIDWGATFQVNFFGPARICRLLIPGMRARGYGKIINISGGGAAGPRPGLSAYAAAKCALVRLSETLAEELRGSGVDVNCVAPGAMKTRMLDELLAAGPVGAPHEYERALAQAQSGGNPPEKAAALVVFLASAASDGITGRLLSALWDDWASLPDKREQLAKSDIYTLRRIVPEDRGEKW
jgi:NAD(P)-dependent dehydrogenase (short-subunit alcohol dehydrogenase family)